MIYLHFIYDSILPSELVGLSNKMLFPTANDKYIQFQRMAEEQLKCKWVDNHEFVLNGRRYAFTMEQSKDIFHFDGLSKLSKTNKYCELMVFLSGVDVGKRDILKPFRL